MDKQRSKHTHRDSHSDRQTDREQRAEKRKEKRGEKRRSDQIGMASSLTQTQQQFENVDCQTDMSSRREQGGQRTDHSCYKQFLS